MKKAAGAYALAGAYLWVVNDLISRYRLRNLVPSSLYVATFRMVIAIPLAAAITAMFKTDFGAPIGFMIGVFPTNTLFLVARRQVGQRFGLGDDISTSQHQLETLQGVNTLIAETFDLVSQALVAIYIDPAGARKYSIRESIDATSLHQQFLSGDANAKHVVSSLAADLNTPEGVVLTVLDDIADDPCAKFIVAIWNRPNP